MSFEIGLLSVTFDFNSFYIAFEKASYRQFLLWQLLLVVLTKHWLVLLAFVFISGRSKDQDTGLPIF